MAKPDEIFPSWLWSSPCYLTGQVTVLNSLDGSQKQGVFHLWRDKESVLLAQILDEQTDVFIKSSESYWVLRYEKKLNRKQLANWQKYKPDQVMSVQVPDYLEALFSDTKTNWLNKGNQFEWKPKNESWVATIQILSNGKVRLQVKDELNHLYYWDVTKPEKCVSVQEKIFDAGHLIK